MTKQDMDAETLAALKEILALIEAGEWSASGDGDDMWLKFHDALRDYRGWSWSFLHTKSFDAFNGSLDAAKVLMEALLPEWAWSVDRMGQAIVWYPFVEGDAPHHGHIDPKNPARAWLIAILAALIWEAEQ